MTPTTPNNNISTQPNNKTIQDTIKDYIKTLIFLPIQFNNIKTNFIPILIITLCQQLTLAILLLIFRFIKTKNIIHYFYKIDLLKFNYIALILLISNLIFSYILGLVCTYFVEKVDDIELNSYAYIILLSTSFIPIFVVFIYLFENINSLFEVLCSVLGFMNGYLNLIRVCSFESLGVKYVFSICLLVSYGFYFVLVLSYFIVNR